MGYILTSLNVIEEKRDIFYLEVDEILYYIDGKSTTNNLKDLIAIRKREYETYKETTPDERFYTYGAVNIGNNFKKKIEIHTNKTDKNENEDETNREEVDKNKQHKNQVPVNKSEEKQLKGIRSITRKGYWKSKSDR